jgi:hypothetical protein
MKNNPPNACAMSIEFTKCESGEASNFKTDLETVFLVVAVTLARFTDSTAAGSPPDITTPSHQALDGSGGGVQSRANVKVKDGLTVGLGIAGVIIDHVTDLLRTRGSLTLNEPVVAVEGGRRPRNKN